MPLFQDPISRQTYIIQLNNHYIIKLYVHTYALHYPFPGQYCLIFQYLTKVLLHKPTLLANETKTHWFISESLHSLTLDGVSNLSTSEVRTRSATLAKHLRVAIDSCKRILVENFQVKYNDIPWSNAFRPTYVAGWSWHRVDTVCFTTAVGQKALFYGNHQLHS